MSDSTAPIYPPGGDNIRAERSFLTLALDGTSPESDTTAIWDHFVVDRPSPRSRAHRPSHERTIRVELPRAVPKPLPEEESAAGSVDTSSPRKKDGSAIRRSLCSGPCPATFPAVEYPAAVRVRAQCRWNRPRLVWSSVDDVVSNGSDALPCAIFTLRAFDRSATGIVIVNTPWS